MSARAVHSLQAVITPLNWLWTWNGACFGYRRGGSLFTYDGVEVGRFSGKEIHGPDGQYIGEIMSIGDGEYRLITSNYKKFHVADAFVPTIERAQPRAADSYAERLYCGHEDFPSPKVLKDMVLELSPVAEGFR